MMEISLKTFKTLRKLVDGELVPASDLKDAIAHELLSEGLLTVRSNGIRRRYRAIHPALLKDFVRTRYPELRDFDNAEAIIGGKSTDRRRQAKASGDSKIVRSRSCPGFPVNSFVPIEAKLNNHDIIIEPPEGSFMFISDWTTFCINTDITVIGVENMENFIKIRNQRHLFGKYLSDRGLDKDRILFVSRYPQSTDLRKWIEGISNRYIHFGDFDLAGINIFLTEFQRYIGHRATLMIPDDINERIASGSEKRYNSQYSRFKGLKADDEELQSLIDLINLHHRCYDQEGYIEITADQS